MTGNDLDSLLAEELTPPLRAPDRSFVDRVDAAVAEAVRFRAWRRRALRRVGSEALVLVALVGMAATLGQASGIAEVLADAAYAPPAVAGAVLLLWLGLSPRRPGTFAS